MHISHVIALDTSQQYSNILITAVMPAKNIFFIVGYGQNSVNNQDYFLLTDPENFTCLCNPSITGNRKSGEKEKMSGSIKI